MPHRVILYKVGSRMSWHESVQQWGEWPDLREENRLWLFYKLISLRLQWCPQRTGLIHRAPSHIAFTCIHSLIVTRKPFATLSCNTSSLTAVCNDQALVLGNNVRGESTFRFKLAGWNSELPNWNLRKETHHLRGKSKNILCFLRPSQ